MRGCRQPEGHKQQRDKREAAAHAREQVPAGRNSNSFHAPFQSGTER
jgi:hypothetical protein